jgi:Zn-dependent protease with chaperone function
MALIVGHEMAHQVQGHLIRGAAHRELGQLLGEAITAFSTLSLARLLDWKHFKVDPDVRQVAQNAVVSVFSQDEEREADIYGAWYAFQAGYDLDRGAAVWERVAAVDEKDPFLTRISWRHRRPRTVGPPAAGWSIRQAGRAAEVFATAFKPPAATGRPPPPPAPPTPGAARKRRVPPAGRLKPPGR